MKKGSITYYLCLILFVMLSLLFAGFYSMRQAAARVVLASGTEQALYSQFARYDRALFDKYGLLFIDAGYGSGKLQAGKMLKEIREDAGYIVNPRKGSLIGGDVLGIELVESETAMTGYVLATDDGGKAFRRQICSQMRTQLGSSAILYLKERLSEEKETEENLEDTRKTITSANADQYYEEDQAGKTEEEKEAEPMEIDENPIDQVNQQKKSGLLALVLPSDRTLSGASVDENEMPSNRTLNEGTGMDASGWQDADEKILLLEYLVEEYPCFLEEDQEKGLQYQVEYVIAGKNTDEDNLRSVMHRLLVIREAANMVFLMKDSSKREVADTLAAAIAAFIPGAGKLLEPIISFLLKVAWAFGESVLDLRELYDGGRIPLVKTNDSWQLQLSNLGSLADSDRHSSDDEDNKGLDYEEYMRLLLLVKSTETIADGLMDLTEHNIRQTEDGFRLDNCVDALSVEVTGRVGDMEHTVARSYGYAMK